MLGNQGLDESLFHNHVRHSSMGNNYSQPPDLAVTTNILLLLLLLVLLLLLLLLLLSTKIASLV